MSSRELEVIVFTIDAQLFALDIQRVEELLWLPALAPMEEQPAYVLGSFDLRGELVRVVDLNLRLGRPAHPIRVDQQLVVTRTDEGLVALVADELNGSQVVWLIDGSASSVGTGAFRPLVTARFEAAGVKGTLLDADELAISDRFPFETLIERQDPQQHLSLTDRESMIERQRYYQRVDVETVQQDKSTLAVVSISNELIGIEASTIQEFSNLPKLFKLPGTPEFVVGNVNLRGEIVTLFDISSLLNLDPVRISDNTRMMVFSYENQRIGFLVDDLLDVTDMGASEIVDVPVGISTNVSTLLKGAYRYEQGSLVILDVIKIFSKGLLIVDQEALNS
jgi:purine-binding chemotaxis protein CheW